MSAKDTAERLMILVPWLLERPGATLQEAAEAVASTPEVLRRELDLLGYCGGPGLGGGTEFLVDILGDRVTLDRAPGLEVAVPPTPGEAARLLLTLQSAHAVLGESLPALQSALDKLAAAAGLDQRAVAASVDSDPVLDQLRTAIDRGLVVEVSYRGRRDDTPREREVEPWQIEFTTQGPYLHAHDIDRGAHRTFRLDRIVALRVTDRAATTTAPADLPSPQWHPRHEDVLSVTLRLEGPAQWLADEIQTTQDVIEDNARIVTFDTDELSWAVGIVLAGAPLVEVVSPIELRAQVHQAARERLRMHEQLSTS